MTEILTELNLEQFKTLQRITKKNILIKFSSKECAPCRNIAKYVNERFSKCDDNILIVDLDIQKCGEIYKELKKNKMVNGIPAILLWEHNNNNRENWFIPDDSVLGGDLKKVEEFFNRVSS